MSVVPATERPAPGAPVTPADGAPPRPAQRHATEPVPGRFPTALGPLPLLRESRANHAGKLLFQWLYWHALLPGRNLPLVGPAMPTAGKQLSLLDPRRSP